MALKLVSLTIPAMKSYALAATTTTFSSLVSPFTSNSD